MLEIYDHALLADRKLATHMKDLLEAALSMIAKPI